MNQFKIGISIILVIIAIITISSFQYYQLIENELTDEEAEDLISSEMEFRQRRLDLDKAFQEELKGVISIQKVLLLNKAERKFKKQLLDRMKGRRKD